VAVGPYERRIACGDRPRSGAAVRTLEGLGVLAFASPWSARGGGHAVVYVPPRHDVHAASPLLVGLHPWNGSMWTYAAYAELLREARARDILLLMPSGLGNSLYTADAEDEVMRAVAATAEMLAVDARAVSLFGASMGGAGATTIGFHHPDHFASVTSFFGDSKYDLATYARSILPNEAAAHLVNALDVVENARNLPVWLIHGEDDRTSSIRQSEILAKRMNELGFSVRFDRVPAAGHSGALVARFLPEVVARARSARVPERVARVTYRSVRASLAQAYGVRLVRTTSGGDAYVDIERREDAVHVLRADAVRSLVLLRGSLGTSTERPPPIVVDDANARGIGARWEP
jgi:pimeloyl-ACP methyl ester carboxylesterase